MTPTRCPKCRAALGAREAGRVVECPACEHVFRVPVEPDPDDRPPPKNRPADHPDWDGGGRPDADRPRPQPRRRRARRAATDDTAKTVGIIAAVVGVLAVVVIGVVVVSGRVGRAGGNDPWAGVRGKVINQKDPAFDGIVEGMDEAEVDARLGPVTWQSSRSPPGGIGGVGIWTLPRMSQQEFIADPAKGKAIEDVIFVYFDKNRVVKIYRVTGEEFANPGQGPPRRPDGGGDPRRGRW